MSATPTNGTADPIHDFLAHKRLALVGVSRDPRDFSRGLFRELRQRGYDVVPVNPRLDGDTVEGAPAAARVQDVTPPVEAALVMTSPEVSESVVRDCARAGVTRVWLHRGAGRGAVSPEAVRLCHEHGIRVVAGACPYMYLPRTALVHRVHGFFHRLFAGHAA